MRNRESGYKSDRSRRGSQFDEQYSDSGRFADDDRNQDRWEREYAARDRDRDWDQDYSAKSRDWERHDYGDVRGGRSNVGARWNEDRWQENRGDWAGQRRWSGESSYGQPIYGGGEFTGGYGWSGREPGRNWRGEGAYGADPYGYGRTGLGGWREKEDRRFADWDDDYHHWRSTQLGKFDEDYEAWRGERRQKFADEFDKWRQGRSGNSGNLSSGGTTETGKETRK